MSVRSTKIVFATVLVLAGGLVLAGSELFAQEEAAGTVVGTYDPQAVAQATGLQQQLMQEMQGLQQRVQEAQQAGDQAALQQLQAEAQQIQQDAATEFFADVESVMPEVAEATGATVIATEVTYTAPGVATQDVTQAVIEAMGGGQASAEPGN